MQPWPLPRIALYVAPLIALVDLRWGLAVWSASALTLWVFRKDYNA